MLSVSSSAHPKRYVVSNVKRAWTDLTFGPQRRDPKQPKRMRPICAVDTETIDGRVWLIADSLGRHSFPTKWLDILEWLEEGELYKNTNFAWNLDYDARAILSYLDDGALLDLAVFGHLDHAQFSIDYIPRKFLVIRYNNHRYDFFDLMQFFNSSLNYSAKRYFNEEKDNLDAKRINNDAEYRAENREAIIAYCLRDADLTARLGVLNTQLYQSMGVNSNRWYSTGYIAGRYFLTHGGIPRYHFVAPQQYAYYSYAGGRFECFQRGYFEQAYKYDIASAYPAVIATLPNLDNGRWVLDSKIDYDADLIFARVRVRVKDNFVQPLHLKYKGLVIYPSTDFHYRILTKSELEVLRDFDLAVLDVKDAWHFYAETSERPFAAIHDMYKNRLKLKAEDDPREIVLKVVMNSLYGKFIQVTPQLLPEPHNKVGPLFVPAYAAEITARTRMQLVRTILEREITPVAMFTDAIITTGKESLASEGLGNWQLETSGELVLLGCGVYNFRGEGKSDTHIRGFSKAGIKDLFDLLDISRSRTHIKFVTERPLSLGEYSHRSLAKSGYHLNQWIDRTKFLNINFDRKRLWPKEFVNAGQVLRTSHVGLALHIKI